MVIFRKSISGVSELALSRFVTSARRAVGMSGRVSVLVTSSSELRDLNRRFRGKDKATDVLSFPAAPIEGDDNEGDIAISLDIAAENAARFGHLPVVELKILALHGILHLAGYDHEIDNGKMARKEARLRRELRLPDALIERTEGSAGVSPVVAGASRPCQGRKKEGAPHLPAVGRRGSVTVPVTTISKKSASPADAKTGSGKRGSRNGQRETGNGKRVTGIGRRRP